MLHLKENNIILRAKSMQEMINYPVKSHRIWPTCNT